MYLWEYGLPNPVYRAQNAKTVSSVTWCKGTTLYYIENEISFHTSLQSFESKDCVKVNVGLKLDFELGYYLKAAAEKIRKS